MEEGIKYPRQLCCSWGLLDSHNHYLQTWPHWSWWLFLHGWRYCEDALIGMNSGFIMELL